MRSFQRATGLNLADYLQQLRCRNVGNGTRAQMREDVALEPANDPAAVGVYPVGRVLLVPLP